MESTRSSSAEFLRHQTSAEERTALLQVPQLQFGQQRSSSIDSTPSSVANHLEVPSSSIRRFQRRRSSGSKSPLPCVHCQYVEEYERTIAIDKSNNPINSDAISFSSTDSSSSDNDDDDNVYSKTDNLLTIPSPTSPCTIKFSLSPHTNNDFTTFPLSSPTATPSNVQHNQSSLLESSSVRTNSDDQSFGDQSQPSSIDIELPVFNIQPTRSRRRSISRQEAIFIEPIGNSLENVSDAFGATSSSTTTINKSDISSCNDNQSYDDKIEYNENFKTIKQSQSKNDHVKDIFLKVPDTDLKRDRAASVDSSFSKLSTNGKTEELQAEDDGFALTVPSNAVRSRSVDIVLPTNEQERYKALALAGPSISKRYVTKITQKT